MFIDTVPQTPVNWSAATVQDIEGNIAGTPDGITYYNQYYAENL